VAAELAWAAANPQPRALFSGARTKRAEGQFLSRYTANTELSTPGNPDVSVIYKVDGAPKALIHLHSAEEIDTRVPL